MNILTPQSQITSIVITENIPGTGLSSLQKDIHLSFVPDIIQLSHVFYETKAAAPADETAHKITSNLITTEDGILQSVYEGVQYSHPMVFSNNKPIDGNYTFNISDGGLTEGIFTMSLTFIKY